MPGELDLALRIQSDFRAAVRDLQGVDRAVGRAGSTSRRASRDTRSLAGSFDLAGSASSGLRASLGSTAALIARVGSGYAALRAGIRVARQELDFERELSKITGLVGIAREQVNAWRKDVLKISRDTGKPLGELARGLFFITSAGQRGSQAIDTLANSAKASAAGLGETATIADAVTSAVNAYTSAVLDSGTATGILVAAVREGKLEASGLAPVVGRVLPIAKQLGVQFHEVAAALAFFSRSGTNAREGATNLRTTLGLILNPGEAARRVLEEVGLDLEELRRTIRERGLLAGLRLLERSVDGNAETIAKVIPSIEALTGVLSLVKGDAREVDAIFASLARAGLTDLRKSFVATADTGSFKLEQSMRDLETAANRLAEKALPPVIERFTKLLELAERFSKTTSVLGAAVTGAAIGGKVAGAPGAAAGAALGTAVALAATGERPDPVVALRAKIEELRRNIENTRKESHRSSQSREQEIAHLEKLIGENERLIQVEIQKNAVADQDIFPDFATAAQGAPRAPETAPARRERPGTGESGSEGFSEHQRRVQELDRLRRDIESQARGLLPPLEQSIADIDEWKSSMTLAFLEIGASAEDYARLEVVYQARIVKARQESADEAEKSENRRRAFLEDVRGDLDAAALDLTTPLERSLAQIDDWYARTAERLDDAGGDLGDYSRLGDVYLKRVDAAYGEHRDVVVDTFGDIETGIDTLSDSIEGAMNRAADAIAEFAVRGKLDFGSLVESILADVIRLQAKGFFLESGIGSFIRNIFYTLPTAGGLGITDSGAYYAAHGGGVVGALKTMRQVDPSVFAGAPRFHEGGILPDEVPIIARRGEGVFTPEQMQALGGPMSISVNFENRGTPQRQVGQPSIRFDLREAVINITIDDIANGGPLGRTIRSQAQGLGG